jgi:hypothetical protein
LLEEYSFVDKASKAPTLKYIAIITLIIMAAFAYSLHVRMPHFGLYPVEIMNIQLDTIPLFILNVNDWRQDVREGRFNFVPHVFPQCLETPNNFLRVREVAYFPIYVLIGFILSETLNQPPSMEMIQIICMVLHFFATLASSLCVFFALRRLIRPSLAVLFTIPAILLQILLPGPLVYYFYSIVPDTLVMPLWGLTILLEMFISETDQLDSRRRLYIIQACVLFLGALTEWLFVPLVFTLFLKRILMGELGVGLWPKVKNTILCGLPVGLGLIVFLLYCLLNNGLFELVSKFLEHADVANNVGEKFLTLFWIRYMTSNLGYPGTPIFLAALLFAAIWIIRVALQKKSDPAAFARNKNAATALFLFTFPCLFHSLILRHHYVENIYTALKFVYPVSAGFCLIPIICFTRKKKDIEQSPQTSKMSSAIWSAIGIALIGITVFWINKEQIPNNIINLDSSHWCIDYGNNVAAQPIEGDVLLSPEITNFGQSLICYPYAKRLIWPLTCEDFPDNIIIRALLAGKSPSPNADVTIPNFFKRPGFFPNIPEDAWKIPEKFTVGLLLDANKPIPPEAEAFTRIADKELKLGSFKNFVISSDALRKLFPAKETPTVSN